MFVKIHTDSNIKEYRGYSFELASPPEGVSENDTFYAMDTQTTYYWDGTQWAPQTYATKQYVDNKLASVNEGYPDYADAEKNRVLAKLNEYWNIDNPIVIGFSTDHHISINSPKILNDILPQLRTMATLTKEFPFNICVLGGDSSSTTSNIADLQSDVIAVTKCLDGAYCPVFHLIGNHDGRQNINTISASAVFASHKTMPIKEKYAITTDESTNCYYDDQSCKVRFIMINSESLNGYPNTLSQAFLSNALSTLPDEYEAIIFSHRPLGNLSDDSSTRVDDWNEPLKWGDVVNPYADRIIACIDGHVHADKHEIVDGILYLSTTCAGWYELNDGSDRRSNQGTPLSTAYDVFVIDRAKHIIHCVRYGNGENRDIQYRIPTWTNVLTSAIDTNGEIYNETGYKLGARLNSTGAEKAHVGAGVTGFIPVKPGDIVRLKNVSLVGDRNESNGTDYIAFYDSDFAQCLVKYSNDAYYVGTSRPDTNISPVLDEHNQIQQFTIPQFSEDIRSKVKYMRISSATFTPSAIVTLNEIIN